MRQRVHSCFLLFLTLTSTTDVKTLLRRFEARYRPARTLQATFLESYTENGQLTRVEAGTVYFRRPGKMRWEYESPEKNVFLVDGKTAWFYVRADRTVTRVAAKQSADWRTPLALLAGEMKLSRVCASIRAAPEEAPESPENAMLYCKLRGSETETRPKEGPNSKSGAPDESDMVYFEVVENTGELVRILVKDPGGVGIEFHFAGWQFNPPVADSLFHFSVPPGVAIVNGELRAGQIQ